MKHTQLKTILLFLIIANSIPVSSQGTEFLRHDLSIHVGYGNMVNSIAGLTLSTHDYKRHLSQGVSWDGQYNFRPVERLAVGLFYSGFSSKGDHAEGSDQLFIHYIAPQISVCNLSYKLFQVRFGVGVGPIFYRDNSKVFGKPRRATGDNIATHMNLCTSYKLTKHWGIGAEAQFIMGKIKSLNSFYHNEEIKVQFKEGNESDISRLNVLAGFSYYF